MRRFTSALLIFVLLLQAAACGASPPVFSVGFSTPEGNEIWVSAAHFDNHTWGVPVGSIEGAWEESGAASSIFSRPLPRNVYVNWLEKATNKRYEATIDLQADLLEQAAAFPDVIYLPTDSKVKRSIDLIIGMDKGGEVTVWLSNYPYREYVSGRELRVVGRARATLTTEVAPYYPKSDTSHRAD